MKISESFLSHSSMNSIFKIGVSATTGLVCFIAAKALLNRFAKPKGEGFSVARAGGDAVNQIFRTTTAGALGIFAAVIAGKVFDRIVR